MTNTLHMAGFDLGSRAMLVSLTISHWTARKLDKRVTNETNQRHNAASDAGRYNKALVDKKALAPILSVINEARAQYFAYTLPWHDGGHRLLPAKAFAKFSDKMRNLRWDFEREVAAFVAAYPQHIDRARATLGDIFNEVDYPAADDLVGKFAFDTSIMPMPVADDFRVSLSDDLLAGVRTAIASEIEAKTKTAHNDLVGRVTEVVGTMAEKLKAYDPALGVGIFRDSLVGNVAKLADLLPELNVTDDSNIDALAAALKSISDVDADDLRGDKALRDSTANEAARLAELAKTYLA
jgi:hypothetical protein